MSLIYLKNQDGNAEVKVSLTDELQEINPVDPSKNLSSEVKGNIQSKDNKHNNNAYFYPYNMLSDSLW